MKIIMSALPKFDWWGKGTPAYENNWAMEEGVIPNQEKVLKEYSKVLENLKKFTEVEVLPFPPELDTDKQYKHDAIFVRDSFISNQNGFAVISNFSERQRQPEIDHVQKYLEAKGCKCFMLSEDAHIEGGDCYFAKRENILFAGTSRNNLRGIEQAVEYLQADEVVIVETKAFHMDTVFCILLDKTGMLCGMIACPNLISNMDHLGEFARKKNIELIEIDPVDSIDFDGKGNITVNCLAIPGVLFGGEKFKTKNVEEKIKNMNILHSITPTSQFLYSAAGYHCLTNELP